MQMAIQAGLENVFLINIGWDIPEPPRFSLEILPWDSCIHQGINLTFHLKDNIFTNAAHNSIHFVGRL